MHAFTDAERRELITDQSNAVRRAMNEGNLTTARRNRTWLVIVGALLLFSAYRLMRGTSVVTTLAAADASRAEESAGRLPLTKVTAAI